VFVLDTVQINLLSKSLALSCNTRYVTPVVPFRIELGLDAHQRRTPLIALAENLKQHLGACLGQRHEAQFIDKC
jgi:hypothetical protein